MRGTAVDYFADFGGILPHLPEIIAIYGGILLLFRRRMRRKTDSPSPNLAETLLCIYHTLK
jgi:hypothetical protein